MLKGIAAEITPELLAELAMLGHGDAVAVVDRNFPAYSHGATVVTLAGVNATEALTHIWSLVPIDAFVDEPVKVMRQDNGENSVIFDAVQQAADAAEGRAVKLGPIGRHKYYEAASEAQLIVKTSDDRPYACVLFNAGVI